MNVARHHAEWLNLVPASGPFLSLPVLLDHFPQGLDEYPSHERAELRGVRTEWEAVCSAAHPEPAIHRQWVRYVLERTLGYPAELLAEGQDLGPELDVALPVYGETLRPDLALRDPDAQGSAANGPGTARLLVTILDPGQSLDGALPGRRWTASPATRMADLLLGTGVRLGLITNGDHWMLVNARRGESTGFASWYGEVWLDEPLTLRAFRSLLDARRLFGVGPSETPEALLDRSAENQQEVTDRLGLQVRQAMEVLIRSLDRSDKDRGRALLREVDERTLYEAALTVMMRLVFLFSAEERGMLQLGNELYDGYYAISTLRPQLDAVATLAGEELLEKRFDAWPRLLATFRAVHGGVWHEGLQIPAYGGRLFDPDRFPFLEGRAAGSSWRQGRAEPLPVNNRAVLHLLRALQVLQVPIPGGGRASRVLSFRALDIEQIGTVYEGLLDHTALRAGEPLLGLAGSKDREPEVALASLEAARARGEEALLAYLKAETGRSEAALRKALGPDLDRERDRGLRAACDNDAALHARVLPFAGLLRRDSTELPMVIAAGSVYVTAGTDRRATGTHYTPRSLTEPIVRHTLEPLVYEGPAEGWPEGRWRLRPPGELLGLKICDMAMGSGAFLVQACRYLAARLVEAWQRLETAHPGRRLVTPEGTLSTGAPEEKLFMADQTERAIEALRLVADRCLFGVDKNAAAVEMARLSLWLVTMQRDRPFTFLDHSLKCGDSLLGVDLAQLGSWSLDRERTAQLSWMEPMVHRPLEHAQKLRLAIARLADHTIDGNEPLKNIEQKTAWLREADETLEHIKLGADLLVATALAPRAGRDDLRLDLIARYQLVLAAVEEHRAHPFTASGQAGMIAAREELRAEARQLLADTHTGEARRPFHWFLEFPEVFTNIGAWEAPLGFDAIIGNPPFQGGQKITGVLGTDYRDYLVEHLAQGRRGSADLVAYFFLRGFSLLDTGGDLSLLATNTIAQGDTREVGLDQLTAPVVAGKANASVRGGATIIRAVPSRKWPGDANLEVAEIWLRRGEWHGSYVLGDTIVPGITTFLTPPGATEGKPHRLIANGGKSLIGSYVLGMGFVLEPGKRSGGGRQAGALADRL